MHGGHSRIFSGGDDDRHNDALHRGGEAGQRRWHDALRTPLGRGFAGGPARSVQHAQPRGRLSKPLPERRRRRGGEAKVPRKGGTRLQGCDGLALKGPKAVDREQPVERQQCQERKGEQHLRQVAPPLRPPRQGLHPDVAQPRLPPLSVLHPHTAGHPLLPRHWPQPRRYDRGRRQRRAGERHRLHQLHNGLPPRGEGERLMGRRHRLEFCRDAQGQPQLPVSVLHRGGRHETGVL